jgi:hypothetical protein
VFQARVPSREVRQGGSGSTPAMLQRLPDDGEATTMVSSTRRARVLGRDPQMLPGLARGCGWRCTGAGDASGERRGARLAVNWSTSRGSGDVPSCGEEDIEEGKIGAH